MEATGWVAWSPNNHLPQLFIALAFSQFRYDIPDTSIGRWYKWYWQAWVVKKRQHQPPFSCCFNSHILPTKIGRQIEPLSIKPSWTWTRIVLSVLSRICLVILIEINREMIWWVTNYESVYLISGKLQGWECITFQWSFPENRTNLRFNCPYIKCRCELVPGEHKGKFQRKKFKRTFLDCKHSLPRPVDTT